VNPVRNLVRVYSFLVEDVGPEKAADAAHRVLRSRSTAYALALLCRLGRIRAAYLQEKGMTEATAYRAIADLRRLGVIKLEKKVQASGNGGQRTAVWRLNM